MTAPVVKAFRTANPDVDITILTRPFFQPFFRDIEGVEFITPDFNGRHKGFGGLVRLSHDISSCGITHIADLHDVLRTKILRRLLHRKRHVAVIDKGRDKKRALTRKNNKLKVQLEPMVDRYRDTVMRLGFPVGALLPVTQAPLPVPEAIGRVVKKKTGKWIGFAPFAKHRGKIYPAEHTDRLIGILTERYKHVFLFGGGPYERDFAEAMEKRHPGAVSVIGKVDLNGELDLISNLDVMISMVSSSMHMASLVGTPVVSIWGATHSYAGF